MKVQPYLFFDGRCEEALKFYKKVLGAEIGVVMKYKESPSKEMVPPGGANKIMHATLKVGSSMIMASDGRNSGKPTFDGFSLSLAPKTVKDAEKVFKKLSDGGEVVMPQGKTFFAKSFGMTKDKFGVHWMVVVE